MPTNKSSRTYKRPTADSYQKKISMRYKLIVFFTLFSAVVVTIIAAKLTPEEIKTSGIAASGITATGNTTVSESQVYQQTSMAKAVSSTADTSAAIKQNTDPLLILVNYENVLPENYEVIPQLMDDIVVDIKMYESLTNMINAAWKDGLKLWIASGYRSVDEQTSIFDRAIAQRQGNGMDYDTAKEDALKTISVPGYSEHHTGLAIDFNTVDEDFADTDEYEWLQQHAAEYGFVQRYCSEKEDITRIDEEVWHYRYVGVDHAKEMIRLNMCLEEYVQTLNQ